MLSRTFLPRTWSSVPLLRRPAGHDRTTHTEHTQKKLPTLVTQLFKTCYGKIQSPMDETSYTRHTCFFFLSLPVFHISFEAGLDGQFDGRTSEPIGTRMGGYTLKLRDYFVLFRHSLAPVSGPEVVPVLAARLTCASSTTVLTSLPPLPHPLVNPTAKPANLRSSRSFYWPTSPPSPT